MRAGCSTASSFPALLAACGGDDAGDAASGGASTTASTAAGPTAAADVKGDLVLASYPDWYGPDLFKDFHAKYPGATVKQATDGDGTAAQIAQLTKNKGDYDLTLAGINACEQFKLAGLLEPFDPARVPNIKGVGQEFLKAYPYGIPTDFGRTGYGYRKDLISERPTTWKELWELAAKYKGKTTMLKYDSDIQGMALRYLGYSVNTKDDGELQAMQKALLELKPNLKAIIDTDFSKALVQGDVFFAIDYDYDIALAQENNKNIEWVQPTEGVAGLPRGLGGAVGLEAPPRRLGAHGLPPRAQELRVLRQRDGPGLHRAGRRAVHQEVDQGQPDPEVQRGGAEGRRVRGLPRPGSDRQARQDVGGVPRVLSASSAGRSAASCSHSRRSDGRRCSSWRRSSCWSSTRSRRPTS